MNETITSGVTSSGLTISSGDVLTVLGTVSNTLFESYTAGYVEQGGTAVATTLIGATAAADLYVLAGGTAIGTVLGNNSTNESGAGENVQGTDFDSTINENGTQVVDDGGAAYSATLNGGLQNIGYYGGSGSGTTYDTTVNSGGRQQIFTGTANNTTIQSGGSQEVSSWGIAVSTTVNADGSQLVNDGSASETTVNSGGSQTVISGGTASDTTVYTGSSEVISSGGSAIGALITGGTVDVSGTVTGDIDFSGTAGGTLNLISTADFSGATIEGFSSNDVIILEGETSPALTFNTATGILNVGDPETLQFAGIPSGASFVSEAMTVSGTASTEIVLEEHALCFGLGTRIKTPHANIPIEELEIGDMILTASGQKKSIKWIGKRDYDGRFIAGNHLALPVCIKQNAIAGGVPSRDLEVSPGHGIFIGGVLVPAWRLVNGISITQAENVESVRYLNIELEDHDVILAENCPTETFLNIGNFRSMFQNAAEYVTRYPKDTETHITPLPRIESGMLLDKIQNYINTRAGIKTKPEDRNDTLRGFIDQAGTNGVVSGWAQSIEHPEKPVLLDIWVGGTFIGQTLANAYRADVRKAGHGSGCHGFEMVVPDGVTGNVEARRSINQQQVLPLTNEAKKLFPNIAIVSCKSALARKPTRLLGNNSTYQSVPEMQRNYG